MKFDRLALLGLAAITVALTTGCSTVLNTAGTDEFSCKPGEPKATCRTPTAIYKSTHGTPPIAETDAPVSWDKLIKPMSGDLVNQSPDAAPAPDAVSPRGGSRSGTSTDKGAIPGLNARTLGITGATVNGRPVREAAQVMRIWIAPWIDKNDDLHYPSYLFTEVQPRRWTFGKAEFAGRGVVVPHKDFASAGPQRSSASAAEQAPRAAAQPATPEANAEGSSPADFQLPN